MKQEGSKRGITGTLRKIVLAHSEFPTFFSTQGQGLF